MAEKINFDFVCVFLQAIQKWFEIGIVKEVSLLIQMYVHWYLDFNRIEQATLIAVPNIFENVFIHTFQIGNPFQFFLISIQQRSRKDIIIINAIARTNKTWL